MLLVTGITGHSGKYFLKELIENNFNEECKVIVRKKNDVDYLKQSGLNLDIYEGDLDNQVFLDSIFQNIDTLLHIASIFYSVKVMKAAVKNHVKRIILVHTTGIYSKFKSASHEYMSIEEEIRKITSGADYTIELIILRPTMIFGYLNDRNISKFIKFVDRMPFIPVINGGRSLIQPVHGKDLGKAYYQVLKSEISSGDYILSGEKAITMTELFSKIGMFLGKKVHILNISLFVGESLAKIVKLLTLNQLDYVERVQRMSENRSFSHDLAFKDFGYEPSSFEDNLKDEVFQYLSYKRNKAL